MNIIYRALFLFSIFHLVFVSDLQAQSSCDTIVPVDTIDLSQDPNASYVTGILTRLGRCCNIPSAGNPRCRLFVVYLHPLAEGVLFDLETGGGAFGNLFYQISCGPQVSFGTPICLTGPGPHYVTFCKSGNNNYSFRITSVAEPVVPDSISINDGCVKELGVTGYDVSTLQWTTVFPGARGNFNSYLSCTTACDTTLVTPQPNYPLYIDIEVCGFPFGGCDTIYSCDTVRVKFFSTLAVEILPKNPTVCFGALGTTITANPSGGSPPYVYNWSNGKQSQAVFVDTGTYIVELGDISGCPPTYDTVVVTSFTQPIEAIAGGDTFTCVENFPIPLNGQIIAASGGKWFGNGTFSPADTLLNALYTPTPTEIANGFATLQLVTTGNGTCPADTDEIRIDLLQFLANYSLDDIPVSCKGDADGVAIINATGARAPFMYNWDAMAGNQSGDSAYNLPAGTYGVRISDSAGCTLDTSVTVIEADSVLSLSIITTPVSCFGDANGSAYLSINGGAPPYTVTWDASILSISGDTALNLASDTFTVSILDSYGCQIDSFFFVDGPPLPLAVLMSKTDVGCLSGEDGTVTALPSGGTAPYTYLWDDSTGFQTTQTAINLKVGTYTVIVTDTNGCTISDTISVAQPTSAITFTYSFTPPSCYGFTDGTATVFPSGGTPPYSYLWDTLTGSQTTQTATGLGAGTYSVIIFDQNSCLFASPLVVNDPAPLFATAVEIVHVFCKGGANGSAKVTPTGGTGPYTYQWDAQTGNQTDSIATNLSAGIYSVFVYDQNGCSYIPGIEILEPDDSLIVLTDSVPVSCKGGSDGMAIGIPIGGTMPYTIQWNAAANSQTTDTATGLPAGSYIISVTDSNGCQADSTVIVTEPATLLSTLTYSQGASCFGDSNGLAAVTVSGGLPPYNINWDAQTGNQTGDTARNLPIGTYNVTIIDQSNCQIDTSISITQPSRITLTGAQSDVSCYGESTGWAFISASGGTPTYTYQWDSPSGFQTGDSATNIPADTHTVVVTDQNGCQVDSSFILTQPIAPLVLGFGAVDIACYGDSNGKAFVIPTGGTAPYSYVWGSNASSQTTDTAFNLKPGTYSVVVLDDEGCSEFVAVTVRGPLAPLQIAMQKKDITCFNGNDGKAFAFKMGGTKPYSHIWNTPVGPQSGDTARNLPAGTVYYTLTDSNGCFIQDSITLVQPPEVLMSLPIISDTICIGNSVEINGFGSGGNGGPYTYLLLPFVPITFPFTVAPLENKSYGFRAIDNKGCQSQTAVFYVDVRDLLKDSIDVTVSGNVCLGDTVFVTGYHSGLYPGYDIEWNTGQLSLQFEHVPLQSRYYTLTISDVCALTIKDSAYVEVYPRPLIDLNDEIARGCAPLTVSFGNMAQDPSITNYLWSFGDGTTSIDPNPIYTYPLPGLYKVNLSVFNTYGCESNNDSSSVIRVFSRPTAAFTSNPPLTDQRTPIVQFISTSAPNKKSLRHRWDFGDGGTSLLRDPLHQYLDTGSYVVQLFVADSNNCIDSALQGVSVNPYFNLDIPNAFTPNTGGGSGGRYDPNSTNNWVFYPRTQGVKDYELQIFNRWGELLFESKDHKLGWDGYYRGRLASQEVYVWKLKIQWENGQSYEGVGDVTLFR